MKLKQWAGALALAMVAAAAQADELSTTPALVNDYDFRGISNNARDPAFQISLDYASDNFWYASLWASQVDFDTVTDVEVDAVLGLSGGSEETVTWDAGIVYYAYVDESEFNYPEIYVGLDRKFTDAFSAGAKLWYSNDYAGTSESATYLEANARFELPKDFGIELHVGRSDGNYWDAVNGDGYTDWSAGVTWSVKGIDLALKWTDGSDLPDGGPGVDLFSTDGRVVFMVSKTFTLAGGEE